MSKQVTLEAEIRAEQGKEKVKKLRSQGYIPAVFYGKGIKNINLVVKAKDFVNSLKKSEAKLNSLFNMKIKDQDKTSEEFVLIRQHQQDPITDEFVHLDFMRVNTKEAIHTKIRIKLMGESPAIKQGLVLAQVLHEMPVKCLPLDIPTFIEVDISKLENAHDAVRVGDIKSDKFTIELPAEQQIIHAEVPRELKVEEAAPAEVSAEVPTTVQGAPAEEGKAEEGKEAKGKEAAKPEAKSGTAKPEAKAAAKPEAKPEKK